jgi:hypothetical protein
MPRTAQGRGGAAENQPAAAKLGEILLRAAEPRVTLSPALQRRLYVALSGCPGWLIDENLRINAHLDC